MRLRKDNGWRCGDSWNLPLTGMIVKAGNCGTKVV